MNKYLTPKRASHRMMATWHPMAERQDMHRGMALHSGRPGLTVGNMYKDAACVSWAESCARAERSESGSWISQDPSCKA